MTKNEFHKKWLTSFASNIPEHDIEKYVVSAGNYIWHVFSWNLIDKNTYLTGNEARKAYNKTDKYGALYIEWFEDDCVKELTFDLRTADKLDKLIEIYVVAKDFSWTYIKTHESMCGPYFLKL